MSGPYLTQKGWGDFSTTTPPLQENSSKYLIVDLGQTIWKSLEVVLIYLLREFLVSDTFLRQFLVVSFVNFVTILGFCCNSLRGTWDNNWRRVGSSMWSFGRCRSWWRRGSCWSRTWGTDWRVWGALLNTTKLWSQTHPEIVSSKINFWYLDHSSWQQYFSPNCSTLM